MFTRKEIVDYSVRKGCNKDLLNKGMATTPNGDVFCIATLSGDYDDTKYYSAGIKSPKEILYCGVYSIRAKHRLDEDNYETRKNIAVTETDGIGTFVYFFEKTNKYINQYYYHGRYKFITHYMVTSHNPNHKDGEIVFKLQYVDRVK